MDSVKLICDQKDFSNEFERCCKLYKNIEIFTAWVGNPGNILPYHHLELLDSVKIYLGISFDQSSPEGIKFLLEKNYDLEIINDKETYHPKCYFFYSNNQIALLLGSSNFTYSGFYANIESNVLLEGKSLKNKIEKYLSDMRELVFSLQSFVPTNNWLTEYELKYKARQEKLRMVKVKDESVKEEILISSSSWLATADWSSYLRHIKKGINRKSADYKETVHTKLSLFEEYKNELKLPWSMSLFDTIENRRRILGKKGYGWLGHIGASGRIQQLLSNGSKAEKKIIVDSINRIGLLPFPFNYAVLRKELEKLTGLGPTIKVWGRILAIIRPEIYCTISSPFVRSSLSVLLEKKESYFETTEGYIELLQLIHQSPWYNTVMPKGKFDQEIWHRRVAFLDVIFY